MNLEDTIRYTLIVYVISGCVNALIGAYRDQYEHGQSTGLARFAIRAASRVALGFLPALPHVWRFDSSLPAAAALELRDARRGVTRFDPWGEVTE